MANLPVSKYQKEWYQKAITSLEKLFSQPQLPAVYESVRNEAPAAISRLMRVLEEDDGHMAWQFMNWYIGNVKLGSLNHHSQYADWVSRVAKSKQ